MTRQEIINKLTRLSKEIQELMLDLPSDEHRLHHRLALANYNVNKGRNDFAGISSSEILGVGDSLPAEGPESRS
jgi:hypothetical protein